MITCAQRFRLRFELRRVLALLHAERCTVRPPVRELLQNRSFIASSSGESSSVSHSSACQPAAQSTYQSLTQRRLARFKPILQRCSVCCCAEIPCRCGHVAATAQLAELLIRTAQLAQEEPAMMYLIGSYI